MKIMSDKNKNQTAGERSIQQPGERTNKGTTQHNEQMNNPRQRNEDTDNRHRKEGGTDSNRRQNQGGGEE
ncbi:hypothetical protein CAP36_11345 [Chitinophagaceae bacterium IBVUCB2]|nr:hypothetical protein CAP36_11345 [Chitinophagaceae bacterium IBVUCB2]